MTFTVYKTHPKIYLYVFKTEWQLILSFARIMEYIDGPPNLRNKYFELDDFLDTYANERKAEFALEDKTCGYAMFGNEIVSWLALFTGPGTTPLRKKEMLWLQPLLVLPKSELKQIAIIAVHKNSEYKNDIKHEFSHVMYEMDPAYKADCKRLLDEMPTAELRRIKHALSGYDEVSMKTEIQAYLSTGGAKGYVELPDYTCWHRFAANFHKHASKPEWSTTQKYFTNQEALK